MDESNLFSSNAPVFLDSGSRYLNTSSEVHEAPANNQCRWLQRQNIWPYMQISKRGECRDLDKNGVFHHETVLYKHLHKFTFLPDRLVATSLGEMHSTGYQPAELHQVAKPNQHIKLQNLHKQGQWERKQCSPPKNNSL